MIYYRTKKKDKLQRKALKIPTYSILANVGILAIFSFCPPEFIDVRL